MSNVKEYYNEKKDELKDLEGGFFAKLFKQKKETSAAREIKSTIDHTEYAVNLVLQKTGISIWNVNLRKLGGNTFGLCNSSSGEMTFDLRAIETENLDHTAMHEVGHHLFAKRSCGGTIGNNVDIMEGLDQKWTNKSLGKVIPVYESEQRLVDDIARNTGTSINEMLKKYERGDNDWLTQKVVEYKKAA